MGGIGIIGSREGRAEITSGCRGREGAMFEGFVFK